MSTSKPPSGPGAATDKDVQALLVRLRCPTPLHVLRTLFLGNIASPRLDVSPMAPVAQAWGGEMPEFASTAEVEEVFGVLVQGLWNRLSEHQNTRNPFHLPRFEVPATRLALHDLARMRAQELKGFVDGLFGSEDEMLLPKKAHEAVVALSELHAMFEGAAALLADETKPAPADELKALLRNVQQMRTMDTIAERADALQRSFAVLVRPLIDQDLSVVFYDLTTVGVEGATELPGDVRAFGLSKDGGIARQFMLGVVQTAEGLPIAHRIWEGNTGEAVTLKPVVEEVLAQFAVRRIVLVADRGLLSLDNLAQLQAMKVGGARNPGAQPLEFILAVPGRRYAEFTELLQPIHDQHCAHASQEVIGEAAWNGLRLVWAHDPQAAAEQTQRRQQTIDEIVSQAQMRAGKLDEQDIGKTFKGRRLSDSGAKAWLYREVLDARLGQIVKVDLQSEAFTYDIDERALQRARLNDGKLLLVTNVADMIAPQVVERYKSLADIERGFRVLKSDIEIAPVFHRLPDRIRAHASICFLALVLHRVLRMQLKDANSDYSPQRALEIAGRIQFHQVTMAGDRVAAGVSELDSIQRDIFDALKLDPPTKDRLDTAL